MISRDKLKELSIKEINAKLWSIEHIRKGIIMKVVIAVVVTILAVVAIYYTSTSEIVDKFNYYAAAVISILLAFILYILSRRASKQYKLGYKSEVVDKILHIINPNWDVKPDYEISLEEVQASDIFKQNINDIDSQDLIRGEIKDVDFWCSEVQLSTILSDDSVDPTPDTLDLIFKGMFCCSTTSKHTYGNTYIEPKESSGILTKIGSIFSKKEKDDSGAVIFDSSEFNKHFAVHSDNPDEVKMLITPRIVDTLLHLRKRYGIYISIIDSNIYCAASFSRNIFEPNIMQSGVKLRDIEELHTLLSLNNIVISELN